MEHAQITSEEMSTCQQYEKRLADTCKEREPTKIASLVHPNGLFIGDRHTAANRTWCETNKIAAIVNLAQTDGVPNYFPDTVKYMAIPIIDADKDDDPKMDLLHAYNQAKVFIDTHMQSEGRVLVHCMEGVSRASSIVTAYLMESEQLTLKSTLQIVKQVRPQIKPNNGFMRALIRLEQKLYGKASLRVEDFPSPITL